MKIIIVLLYSIQFNISCIAFQKTKCDIDLNEKAIYSTTYLDLSNCGLVEIPKEVFLFKNLQRLNLSNNHISSLPKEIINLKELKYLRIDNNEIQELPIELSGLNNLVIVYAMNNKLTTIPDQLTEIDSLGVIMVTGNPILLNEYLRLNTIFQNKIYNKNY